MCLRTWVWSPWMSIITNSNANVLNMISCFTFAEAYFWHTLKSLKSSCQILNRYLSQILCMAVNPESFLWFSCCQFFLSSFGRDTFVFILSYGCICASDSLWGGVSYESVIWKDKWTYSLNLCSVSTLCIFTSLFFFFASFRW